MKISFIDFCPLRCNMHKNIICDGWLDVHKRSVYNVLISSCKGTMFWKTIDASIIGLTITGEFIWSHIKGVIQEIGLQNVVQVVTDNGSNVDQWAAC